MATLPIANKEELIKTECWIFDLDNTLYPSSCDLFTQIDQKMTSYIVKFLKVNTEQANQIRKSYHRDYGTTMSGMMALHGMEPRKFLDYVHDIDLKILSPNSKLDKALSKLSGRKIVFTNGTVDHAERILNQLTIRHHFEEIFDIIGANYIPKPFPEPYAMLIENYRIETLRAVMVEDLVRNLLPAAALGITTVWARPNQQLELEPRNHKKINHVIDNLTCWLSALASI
jgi:putative hydrolase of the HAD superfamily